MDEFYEKLNRTVEILEKNNPGKTIILNATTLETILISSDPTQITNKVSELNTSNIIPLFIGGPYQHNEPTITPSFCL